MVKELNEDSEYLFEDAPKPKQINVSERANDDSRAGQLMDVISYYNIGRMIVRLIPENKLTDGKKRLHRIVRYGVAGRVIDPTSDKGYKMNVQIPATEDFKCKLTNAQFSQIVRLREQAKKFSDFTSFNNKGKYPQIAKLIDVRIVPQQVFAFGKLLDQKSDYGKVEPATLGHTRIFKFAKGTVGQNDFYTVLKTAIDTKNDLNEGCRWQKDYFAREEGTYTHCMCIQISKGQQYNVGVSFTECKPFELTARDLELAGNLDTRVYNIESFDSEYYDKLEKAFALVEEEVSRLATPTNYTPEPQAKQPQRMPVSEKKIIQQPVPDFSSDPEEGFPF